MFAQGKTGDSTLIKSIVDVNKFKFFVIFCWFAVSYIGFFISNPVFAGSIG
jgi:hypothetical protein